MSVDRYDLADADPNEIAAHYAREIEGRIGDMDLHTWLTSEVIGVEFVTDHRGRLQEIRIKKSVPGGSVEVELHGGAVVAYANGRHRVPLWMGADKTEAWHGVIEYWEWRADGLDIKV